MKRIKMNKIFVKLFIFISLFCFYDFTFASVMVNTAPWMSPVTGQSFIGNGQVSPVSSSSSTSTVPIAYKVDYGKWSETHSGPADCEASCSAMGKKCIADISSAYKVENLSKYDQPSVFLCSNNTYEDGKAFGVVWTIGDFQNTEADPEFSAGKEACESKNATLVEEYSGDNYYWGGIALCKVCEKCSEGKKICPVEDNDSFPPSYPSIGNGGGSGGSGGSSGGDEPNGCAGMFNVLPTEFLCTDSFMEAEVDWKVVSNDDTVNCTAKTTPALESPWVGTKSIQGQEGPFTIELGNEASYEDGVTLSLECVDSTDRIVWSGSETIQELNPFLYDPDLPEASIGVTETDGSPLKEDGPNGEVTSNSVKVSWSCPAIPNMGFNSVVLYNGNQISDKISGEINITLESEGSHTFMILCEETTRCDFDSSDMFTFSNVFPDPVIKSFSADPKVIQGEGILSTDVKWESEYTKYCEFDGKQYGSDATVGKDFPADNQNNRVEKLDLTCYGYNIGKSTSTTTRVILKYPPRIISFEIIPEEISVGGTVSFDWVSENANSCSIDEIQSLSQEGSGTFSIGTQINDVGEKTFNLTCRNDSSYTASAEAKVKVTGTPCAWVSDDVANPKCDGTAETAGVQRVYGCVLNDSSCVPTNGFDKNNPPEDGCGDAGKCPPLCVWTPFLDPSDEECDAMTVSPPVSQIWGCYDEPDNGPIGENCLGGSKSDLCENSTNKMCGDNGGI